MKQEVTRRHKADAWALDDVVYHTDVTTMQDDHHCKAPAPEGLYVHGLFLDGGAWNRHDKMLIEQEPKKLFVPLPVLQVSGTYRQILHLLLQFEVQRREEFAVLGFTRS